MDSSQGNGNIYVGKLKLNILGANHTTPAKKEFTKSRNTLKTESP